MATSAKDICDLYQRLSEERLIHEPTWKQCCDVTNAVMGSGFSCATPMTSDDIRRKNARRFDTTAEVAVSLLTSNLLTGLTPPNSVWFGLQTSRENRQETAWFQESAKTLWRNLHSSNYTSKAYDTIGHYLRIGYGCLYIDEDPQGGYRFIVWNPASIFLTTTRADGEIDTVIRRFKLTGVAALAEYGAELSEETRKKIDANGQEKIDFVQIIKPNTERDVNANLRFASISVEKDQKKIVRKSGYMEFPLVIPRGTIIPDTCYANGKVLDVLADAQNLDQLVRNSQRASNQSVNGTYIAANDSEINTKTIRFGEGQVIMARTTDSIKLLPNGAQAFDQAHYMMERMQSQIRDGLMTTIFQTNMTSTMSAKEVTERMSLYRQQLAAVFGNLQTAFVRPLVIRCFWLAYRAGAFSRPPESLEGKLQAMDVRYLDPLSRAAQESEIQSMLAAFNASVMVAQAYQKPDILDNFDPDKMVRDFWHLYYAPAGSLRNETERDSIRQDKAMQQAAMASMAAQTAQQNPEAAGAMANMMQTGALMQ